jgi:hypothetical protein
MAKLVGKSRSAACCEDKKKELLTDFLVHVRFTPAGSRDDSRNPVCTHSVRRRSDCIHVDADIVHPWQSTMGFGLVQALWMLQQGS